MLKPEMQPAAVPPQAAAPRSALRERLLDPRTLISFAILAVVLFAASRTVKKDVEKLQTWMKEPAKT